MRKATQAELLRRIESVMRMIRRGEPMHDIYQFCRDTYGVNDRQARNYVAAAREKFAEEGRLLRAVHLGKLMARLDDLYARACNNHDPRMMLAVLKQFAQVVELAPTATSSDPRLESAVDRLSELVPAPLRTDTVTMSDIPGKDMHLYFTQFDETGRYIANPAERPARAPLADVEIEDDLDTDSGLLATPIVLSKEDSEF